MTDLIISGGRFYRTANGEKVCVYRTDGCPPDTVHGAILRLEGWDAGTWDKAGMYDRGVSMLDDIAGKWEEPTDRPISVSPECSKGMTAEMFEDVLGKKWLVRKNAPNIRIKFKEWIEGSEQKVFAGISSAGNLINNCQFDGEWYTIKGMKELSNA